MTSIPLPRLALLTLIAAGAVLSGCAAPMPAVVAPAAAPPPVAPVPALPAPPAPPPPVLAPVAPPPAPPMASGPTDARSGLHQNSVIAITGDADSRFTVLFRPALTDPGRVAAAPAQLCRQAGRDLAGSRMNTPGAGSALPGVQMMIVSCTAA